MTASLRQRSKNLTSLSLESFINDITAEGENLSFDELLLHPSIHTVKPQFQSLIRLFDEGTYLDYVSQKYKTPTLNQRQISTLRKLTLLTTFKGVQTVSLHKLSQMLDLGQDEVIDLLLSMNIAGSVNTKIDEQAGKVLILASEIRVGQSSEEKNVTGCKISRLIQKNLTIACSIVNLKTMIS